MSRTGTAWQAEQIRELRAEVQRLREDRVLEQQKFAAECKLCKVDFTAVSEERDSAFNERNCARQDEELWQDRAEKAEAQLAAAQRVVEAAMEHKRRSSSICFCVVCKALDALKNHPTNSIQNLNEEDDNNMKK